MAGVWTVAAMFLLVCLGTAGGFSLPYFQSLAAAVSSDESRPLRILAFGGNGFIGGTTVAGLVQAGHEVTIVSRGTWYWDSHFLVRPYVTQIKCDRLFPLERCAPLVAMVSNSTFDVVIDFSAYHLTAVTNALQLLKGKMNLYIYISTDSVYDVCEKSHSHPSSETDSVRPASVEKQKELEGGESYGHLKLEIEEELARQRAMGGVPYIALRLPDVVGPRDNTYRWWVYQAWIKMADHLDKALAIPAWLVDTPMSLVYVGDVARVLIQLMRPKPEALDQAFNLALAETPTLEELLEGIKGAMNRTEPRIQVDGTDKAIHLFPSVRNGPVDITKAKDILQFTPTPLSQVISETVDFYEKAMTSPYFNIPRREIIRNMQAHFTSKPYKVMLGLKKHYGLDFQAPRDEL